MSSFPNLAFITWLSPNPKLSANFYQQFGIHFGQQQHGTGPIHFAYQTHGLAIELYPTTERIVSDTSGTVIGFEVGDVDDVIAVASIRGFEVIEGSKVTPIGRRVIVRDPDGRRVFFYSSN